MNQGEHTTSERFKKLALLIIKRSLEVEWHNGLCCKFYSLKKGLFHRIPKKQKAKINKKKKTKKPKTQKPKKNKKTKNILGME